MAAPVVSNSSLLELTETAIKKEDCWSWIHSHYSKNSFYWASQIRDRIKIAQERTSFWPTARRACARRAARIHQDKINGRHCVPPTIWLSKSRKVLSWCIYTTTLEPILSKILEKRKIAARFARGIPTPAARPARGGTQSPQKVFSILF